MSSRFCCYDTMLKTFQLYIPRPYESRFHGAKMCVLGDINTVTLNEIV